MLTIKDIAKVSLGLKRLIKRKPDAVLLLGTTRADAAKSFNVLLIALPFFIFYAYSLHKTYTVSIPLSAYSLVAGLIFIIKWTIWPILIYEFSKLINNTKNSFAYISAYNWFNGFAYIFNILINIIQYKMGANGTPSLLLSVIMMSFLAFYCYYSWYINRYILGLKSIFAIIALILSFFIELMLNGIFIMTSFNIQEIIAQANS